MVVENDCVVAYKESYICCLRCVKRKRGQHMLINSHQTIFSGIFASGHYDRRAYLLHVRNALTLNSYTHH
jgi:hypothetical protein